MRFVQITFFVLIAIITNPIHCSPAHSTNSATSVDSSISSNPPISDYITESEFKRVLSTFEAFEKRVKTIKTNRVQWMWLSLLEILWKQETKRINGLLKGVDAIDKSLAQINSIIDGKANLAFEENEKGKEPKENKLLNYLKEVKALIEIEYSHLNSIITMFEKSFNKWKKSIIPMLDQRFPINLADPLAEPQTGLEAQFIKMIMDTLTGTVVVMENSPLRFDFDKFATQMAQFKESIEHLIQSKPDDIRMAYLKAKEGLIQMQKDLGTIENQAQLHPFNKIEQLSEKLEDAITKSIKLRELNESIQNKNYKSSIDNFEKELISAESTLIQGNADRKSKLQKIVDSSKDCNSRFSSLVKSLQTARDQYVEQYGDHRSPFKLFLSSPPAETFYQTLLLIDALTSILVSIRSYEAYGSIAKSFIENRDQMKSLNENGKKRFGKTIDSKITTITTGETDVKSNLNKIEIDVATFIAKIEDMKKAKDQGEASHPLEILNDLYTFSSQKVQAIYDFNVKLIENK